MFAWAVPKAIHQVLQVGRIGLNLLLWKTELLVLEKEAGRLLARDSF